MIQISNAPADTECFAFEGFCLVNPMAAPYSQSFLSQNTSCPAIQSALLTDSHAY
jgi:hypothetical protein